VPRKVRELKDDLRRAGYQRIPRRGKGSHDSWAHPAVPGTVTISGSDGGDALPYQEAEVRAAVRRAVQAEKGDE